MTVSSEPVPVPHGLGDRLVERLRDQLHVPDGYVQLGLTGTRGSVQVASSVIADIARAAATELPGVTPVGASYAEDRFQLQLVLTYGTSAEEIAARARRIIADVLHTSLGVHPTGIDIDIVDVYDPFG